MKRCQKCSRTFPDENQKFCTFDGGLLLADQPTFDPNRTILAPQMDSSPQVQLPPTPAPPARVSPAPPSVPERDLSETIVAYRPNAVSETTEASQPTTALSSQTAPDLPPQTIAAPVAPTSRDLVLPAPPVTTATTSSDLTPPRPAETSRDLPPAPVAAPPPTAQPTQPVQSTTPAQGAATVMLEQPPAPTAKPAKPAKKKSIVPLIIGVLVVLLLGVVGLGVAGYIFRAEISQYLKPYLEPKSSPTPGPVGNSNANTNTNANTNSSNTNSSGNANTETKKAPPPFVPPADAEQFTNAKDNLDGDLAAHYVDFSFYYPKAWLKDPKAGVPGASNFALVDHHNADDALQERVAFNWYPSKGSYESDAAVFPESAKKVTDHLPNFVEVRKGEITLNNYKGYEVRFKGEFKNGTNSLPYWGRLILLPPGAATDKGGVAILMLATSNSPDVTSADDVGVKGELKMILDSFRLQSKP